MGKLPFFAEKEDALHYKIFNEPFSPLESEAKKVAPMIDKCLRKSKEERYPDVVELQMELAEFLNLHLGESLSLTKSRVEKIKLCTDLLEIHALRGDAGKCVLYLEKLVEFVKNREFKERIEKEAVLLKRYEEEGVSIEEQIPGIEEIIHRARMGG